MFFDSDPNLEGQVTVTPVLSLANVSYKVYQEGFNDVYKGGISDVYRGVWCGSPVAIKCIRVNIGEKSEKTLAVERRLKRESAVWRALSHPNILPFLSLYNSPEYSMGMVSPWMERGNIMDHLRRSPNTDRSLLIRDVASGLAYLHSKPIIHGDLKGHNVLIDDNGKACIADFGLSRILEPISEHFPVGGSVRWMAPELLHYGESRETPASDVYSFACTCYEIYTGDPPFHNIPSVFDVILAVYNHQRLPRPSTHIAASIWELMESCWDAGPDARPRAIDIYDSLTAIPHSPATQASDEDPQLQGSVNTDISADIFREDTSVQGHPLNCENLLSRL
ncbi:hypothetical protein PILCRDRAFT_826119 [Piloderma croceum F 1598]|uniref:Protein kinase domain-containing protein n=1 Tax=Piloderma croceum (strain F 1598) TaxID=765440 RepID=A0A0C3BHA4_PILCF|nr:hypothetical protein PILCRDRAFT_826119 [Piloderma croceum F 1598]